MYSTASSTLSTNKAAGKGAALPNRTMWKILSYCQQQVLSAQKRILKSSECSRKRKAYIVSQEITYMFLDF